MCTALNANKGLWVLVFRVESCCPGPGGSWGSGVSAILPASKEAESPSRKYHTIPYRGGYGMIQNQAFSKEWDVLFSELEYFDKIRYGGDMDFFWSALATARTETSAVA